MKFNHNGKSLPQLTPDPLVFDLLSGFASSFGRFAGTEELDFNTEAARTGVMRGVFGFLTLHSLGDSD